MGHPLNCFMPTAFLLSKGAKYRTRPMEAALSDVLVRVFGLVIKHKVIRTETEILRHGEVMNYQVLGNWANPGSLAGKRWASTMLPLPSPNLP